METKDRICLCLFYCTSLCKQSEIETTFWLKVESIYPVYVVDVLLFGSQNVTNHARDDNTEQEVQSILPFARKSVNSVYTMVVMRKYLEA